MARYVRHYGNYRDALVAYNAGPGRVGGSLPAETQHYIATILGGRSGAQTGAERAGPAAGGMQHVELGHQTSFDQAGFEQAQRRALLGGIIAKHRGTGGILFTSGALSTTAPSRSDFTTSRLTSRIVGGQATPAAAAPGGGGLPKGHSGLFELFWQGPHGINVKNGQPVPQGFVSGHTDHVHVAAGPNTVVALGKIAQRLGLHVGENPHFGGVTPVHVSSSYHYKGEAIDVSGDPGEMAVFAHQVARKFGVR
jgi:hypothetical protein